MYKLRQSPAVGVIRIADNLTIPFVDDLPEYIEYQSWLAASNTPQAADPVPVPSIVTMRQARLALLSAGLLPQVSVAIAAIADPAEKAAAEIEWDYAATVVRGSPLVATLAAAMSLTDSQLDSLFTQAAAL
jgi:hypothetical protein